MRELKVRAWHKPYKQMCNVSMLQFDYDGTICAAWLAYFGIKEWE